jgi:hypothetical protein
MPVVAFAVAVALARHSRESGNPVTVAVAVVFARHSRESGNPVTLAVAVARHFVAFALPFATKAKSLDSRLRE